MGFIRFTLSLLRNSNQRKHFFRWLSSSRKDYLLSKKQPWLTFDAIDFLNSLSLVDKKIFEYGSGGSTLFWINHGAECVSIEHNQDWYRLIRSQLAGINGIDYRLALPEPANSKEALNVADPNLYLSEDILYRGYNFKNYVSQIDTYPNNFFDIVLIDGRARPACIKHSHKKIKIGGFLILDNSDREYYLRMTSTFLYNYEQHIFRGATPEVTWFTETSIFTRKS
ncbi:MAG: hypothetical protein ABFD45_00310 [Smithella sp.]|jgi:hypothetical protein